MFLSLMCLNCSESLVMATSFKILLAEKVIGIHALFSEVRDLCTDYLTEREADFEITISTEDIAYERAKADREAQVEGHKPIDFPDSYLETLAVYRKIAEKLIEDDTILFHGSVVAVDGVGYLFTAKSGTGKSTHTRLWREVFGSRAVMVNDDKPLLRVTQNQVIAYGTPWAGKHRLSTNTSVPLRAICELKRSDINTIHEVDRHRMFALLCQQSHRPATKEGAMRHIELIDRLGICTSFYELHCNMQREAAIVAFEGLSR